MSDATAPAHRPAAGEHTTPHHRAHIVSVDGKSTSQLTLPLAFSAPVRTDLIQRAVTSSHANRRQPYGTLVLAGLQHSVEWSGKGKGVARTPRLMGSMRGAQAPNTVGGRPAHPPRVERIWTKKINQRERRAAFQGALAATRLLPLVRARGHDVPDDLALPVVVEPALEQIATASAARGVLEKLRLWDDIERAKESTHLRAGRGRRRGRVRRTARSLLVVTSAPGKAIGFRNLAGVEVVPVGRLGTEDLAPGGVPGRLTVFSPVSIDALRARLAEGSP